MLKYPTLGTLLIPSAILLGLDGWGIGYLLAFRQAIRLRKVISFGTGQRNLAAALLVAAHSFGTDKFVMTMVAAFSLTVTMFVISALWMKRANKFSF